MAAESYRMEITLVLFFKITVITFISNQLF